MNEFVPIALMKIEGQLGHSNAIQAAELELKVLTLKHDGNIPKDVLGTFFSQYIDTRKQIDEYVQNNLSAAMEQYNAKPQGEVNTDDVIAMMNEEMNRDREHNDAEKEL